LTTPPQRGILHLYGGDPTTTRLMTDAQLQQYRYLRAEWKYAAGIYHDCLSRKASDAERHAAEAACSAAKQAADAFYRAHA